MYEQRFRLLAVGAFADTRQKDSDRNCAVYVVAVEDKAVRLLAAPLESVEMLMKLFDVPEGSDFGEEIKPCDIYRRTDQIVVAFQSAIEHRARRVEFE